MGSAIIKVGDRTVTINNDGSVNVDGENAEEMTKVYQGLANAFYSRFYVPSWCNAVADWMVENFKARGKEAEVVEYEKLPEGPGIIY